MHDPVTARCSAALAVTQFIEDPRARPLGNSSAPTARYRALQDAYHVALDASIHAAHVLDGLALAVGAPSRVLGLARAAVSMQSHRRGSQSQVDPDDLRSPDSSSMHSRFSTGVSGPVEQAIRDRKVHDPVILLRAAAIDDAARQLIIQADNALPAPRSSVSFMMAQPAVSCTAQLVAQSFPSGPVTERPIDAGLTPHDLLNDQPATKDQGGSRTLPAALNRHAT